MKLVIYNLVLLLLLVGLALHYRNSVTPKQLVYQICQATRESASLTEQSCGDVQDMYGLEYLCQNNNSSVTNHCWVEKI